MSNFQNGDDGIDIGNKAILQQNNEDDLEKQKLMNEYKEELAKIQEDIATLRLVLNDKIKRENELKTLLGISFVDEIKQDLSEGLNSIKSTTAYQKTSASLKSATQKITPTFQTWGGTVKNSLGSLRSASLFKSFEAGIGSTFSGNKIKNSQSEFNVEENTHADGIPSSKTTNGISKQDAILEDN
ncbi:unnamed protein product [Brachionus calyciflorus]|uniref:Tumor protein D52 n=1 Tax=Brachionus calyciflorus TaxID=104777 RepID=A0A813LVA2_9BILA|nr:unnamed protein product [Brachionus calyciflorus]